MKAPEPLIPSELEECKVAGRRKAEEDIRRYGLGRRSTVFTDGLGAMGAGSWEDGPAAAKQAEYDRIVFASEGTDREPSGEQER